MKKLSILLLILPFIFFSCSSDDSERMIEPTNPTEPTQDYTSFVFEQSTGLLLENCVVGYFSKDGLCLKIADLGNIDKNNPSKEIKITNNNITDIHLFVDIFGTVRFDEVYTLLKNRKNTFKISEKIKGIEVDKNNPKEYPH